MRIAIAQLTAGNDWRKNLRTMLLQLRRAADNRARAILFPENALFVGNARLRNALAGEIEAQALPRLGEAARRNRIAILVGSFPERVRGSKRHIYNTSLWIDEGGRELARYRKIHLFDVTTPSGERHFESAHVKGGRSPVVFTWRGIRIGMSVCFDLRFPEHYRALSSKGVDWILIPSAFTAETGAAHWHTLVRARAIENLSAVLAPAQTGTHGDGRKTYGHSLAVDAWGRVLLDAGSRAALRFVDVPTDSEAFRKRFPVLKLRQPG
jgi:predicted amidohydrolase